MLIAWQPMLAAPVRPIAARRARRWRGRLALGGLVALAGCGRTASIDDHAVRDGVDIRLEGEGSTWRASLLLPTGTAGRVLEVPVGREVHVPLGAEVRFALTSRDYICDFSLPELDARDFAAPELPGQLRVRPDHAGHYQLRGDELCGLPHGDQARGLLVVEDHGSWKSWVAARRRAAEREASTR